MTSLQCGVLPVVGEAEKLARVGFQARLAAVHPAQCAGHQHGGCRAAALGRQRGEARAIARRSALGVPAAETDSELARQEPHRRSRADLTVGRDQEAPCACFAVVPLEPRAAAGVELEPSLRVVPVAVAESEVGIVGRMRCQETEESRPRTALRARLRRPRPAWPVAHRRYHARGRTPSPPGARAVPDDIRAHIRDRSVRRKGACPRNREGIAGPPPSPRRVPGGSIVMNAWPAPEMNWCSLNE